MHVSQCCRFRQMEAQSAHRQRKYAKLLASQGRKNQRLSLMARCNSTRRLYRKWRSVKCLKVKSQDARTCLSFRISMRELLATRSPSGWEWAEPLAQSCKG